MEDVKKDELTILTDKTTGIFFACAPADLNGENLVVTVTTEKGVYEKDIDLKDKNLSFKAGKVSKFTVTGFKPLVTESWNLVTDASTLKVGDELVIASNEKGVVAGNITKDYLSGVISAFSEDMSTIAELGQGAVVFTLGGEADAWTLSNSEGKLLGCTEAKKVAWAKGTTTWKISIGTNSDATIQSTNTSYGRFLYNVNNSRFTTYTSATNTSMLLPQIYRRKTTIVDPNRPILIVTPGKYDTKIPAAGQTLKFKVMTNQAEWTVTSSDVTNFAVAKAADGFTVTVSKNTDAADRTANITVTAGELTKTIALTQSRMVSVKQYTLTINTNNFNSDSYAANNKVHTTAAVAEDGSKLDITWQSNQVMLQSKAMQWQKNTGAIYNVTDLGKIISVTVNKTSEKSGTFTTYYGTSQKPTKDTTVGGGYFQTKVGSDNTGKTSSIVIVFNK